MKSKVVILFLLFYVQVAEDEKEGLLNEFQVLLETVLQFVSHFTRIANKFSMKPTAKFWKALQHKCHDMLDKVKTFVFKLL